MSGDLSLTKREFLLASGATDFLFSGASDAFFQSMYAAATPA